jgi:hypothetical protein
MLLFGSQDAAYAVENRVIAAESLDMGCCFLGMTPYKATRIQKAYCMDEGYLSQGYSIKQKARIDIEIEGKDETYTYADHSWTEHISRKWGQWLVDPSELLEQLAACGFEIELPGRE